MAKPARSMLIVKMIAGIVVQTAVFAAALFGPAPSWDWWRAWVFIAGMTAAGLTGSIGILNLNEDLLAERLKPMLQKGQPLADKVIVTALIAAFGGLMVFIPVDVFRLHLLPEPNAFVSSLGLVLLIVGWWIAYSAMRANAFAAPVVKYQEERAQVVVDTGPYSIVRHPMYSGGSLLLIGTPLWLESYAATVLMIVLIGLLMLRIFVEERLLRRELHGYSAYAGRVRYRLIPMVW